MIIIDSPWSKKQIILSIVGSFSIDAAISFKKFLKCLYFHRTFVSIYLLCVTDFSDPSYSKVSVNNKDITLSVHKS